MVTKTFVEAQTEKTSSDHFRENFFTVKTDSQLKNDYESFFEEPVLEEVKGPQSMISLELEEPSTKIPAQSKIIGKGDQGEE